MKCTIPGVNLKVFGRAIQSLSKIGDELYFEPLEDGLYLRTVNSCRSAYGCFQFSPTFFIQYVDSVQESRNAKDRAQHDEELKCKLGMKSVMTVFRNLSNIDKTVEKCCLTLDMKEARLTFLMYCRHGMVKTHNLAFIECETLQAVFSKDLCPNKLTAPPKVLCDAVVNFQTNQEEITLTVRPDLVTLKNYSEDEPDPKKVINTELTLSPDEFDNYQVGVDTSITFCLKELRAVLSFADVTGLPLMLHFESAGRPVTMSISSDLSFEANFVLATLAEVDSAELPPQTHTNTTQSKKSAAAAAAIKSSSNPHRSQSQVNGHRSHQGAGPSTNHNHIYRPSHQRNPPPPIASTSSSVDHGNMDDGDDEELANATMDVTEDRITTDITLTQSRLMPGSSKPYSRDKDQGEPSLEHSLVEQARNVENEARNSLGLDNSVSVVVQQDDRTTEAAEDFDDLEEFMEKSGLDKTLRSSSVGQAKHLSLKSSESSEQSPVIPLMNQDKTMLSPLHDLQEEEEDDEADETIPGTPPSKKFRSVFFGTQSSTQPSQSQNRAVILAPNSDDES